MATTVGQLTGTPGVCVATLGPGATNLATGVANELDRFILNGQPTGPFHIVYTDTLINVEGVFGSLGDDVLTGDDNINLAAALCGRGRAWHLVAHR